LSGLFLNAIPFFLPKIIVRKKVKNPVFESTVRVVVGMFLFLFLYIFYFFFFPVFFEFESETSLQKIVQVSVVLCLRTAQVYLPITGINYSNR
jgi:hypothetical protein